MNVKKAEQFILENARPVELAKFQRQFQNGSVDAVIQALKPFQNPDGGFGHALEPDNWNPNSSPMTTNNALFHLFEAGALKEAEDMARGMAQYLKSSVDPEKLLWPGSIDSNKDYPHAIWWERQEDDEVTWNPGVSLAAFLVCMGEGEPWRGQVQKAFQELEKERDDNTLKCFILAYGLLKQSGVEEIVDFDHARQAIQICVQKAVCTDVSKYGVEYVPTPSTFPGEFLPESLVPQIRAELAVLDRLQMEDGGFDIPWQWYTPYEKEFQQARAWWRPRITIEKLSFYREWASRV
ncbi:hypothetical protein D7X94_08350 [Acutalibacter sp. 1XD8-33]|uniref:hypothetical protein n=1 Tax=Acutalibacter sp. 1XD8-33 TaxID=2320081 RepID=UPI000EA285B9|nr:hypothetical protein [Acutalibacter sp. 1XD8-33]RKJ40346.1 hypothetical protein D7X94_08350 [Acutalibacter sp. 1XD8-33]